MTAPLKERDAFLKRMKSADIKSRDARSEIILERHVVLADKRQNDQVDPKEVREFIRKIRKAWQDARGIELRTLTKKGPLAGLYLIHAQLSSDAVHPSMESLSRYVKRGSTVKLQFQADSSNAELVDTLTWACAGSIGAFLAGSELLNAPELNVNLAKLAQEYDRLANAPDPRFRGSKLHAQTHSRPPHTRE